MILWFTKKSLVTSSAQETNKWGLTFIPVAGNKVEKSTLLTLADMMFTEESSPAVMTNYETLNTNYKELANLVRKSLARKEIIYFVIDEVHRLRGGANPSGPTKMWKNFAELLNSIPTSMKFPIFLSGSPINNKPEDVWAYLHLYDPHRFPSVREFNKTFKALSGMMDAKKLAQLFATNMVMRTIEEVGEQIATENTIVHELEIPKGSQLHSLYKSLSEQAAIRLEQEAEVNITSLLAILTYCRKVLLSAERFNYNRYMVDPISYEVVGPIPETLPLEGPYPKLDYTLELVEEILSSQSRGVVVWSSQMNTPFGYIERHLTSPFSKITGETKNPREEERKFQTGETRVMLANMMAAAEGFNFQATATNQGGARHAILTDMWWNPETNRQAERRIRRIDTVGPVTYHHIKVKGTVDGIIDDILTSKREIIDNFASSAAFRPGDWAQKLREFT